MGELLQPTHLLLILIVALLLFGPKKLPELGKGIGEGLRALKEGMKDTPPEQPKSPSTEVKGPDVKS
jgi:sec-independent protein translocase protein TatA